MDTDTLQTCDAGTFSLTIGTDGAAFDGPDAIYEVRRILAELGAGQWSGERELNLRDVNGNTCGTVRYVPAETDNTGETVDLDELDTLGDALDALGIVGTVEPGDRLHGEYERTDGASATWRATARAFSWTFTAPGAAPITGGYWTGSAVTGTPTTADVFASLVMDATYLADEDGTGTIPDGLSLADVDIIREREQWICRALAGADGYPTAFDRLAELAHDLDG